MPKKQKSIEEKLALLHGYESAPNKETFLKENKVASSSIYSWRKTLKNQSKSPTKNAPKAPNKNLQAELEQLKLENTILKALVKLQLQKGFLD